MGSLLDTVRDITAEGQHSATAAFASALGAVAAGAADLGGRAGAITLSTDQIPVLADGRLTGRASWLAPLADNAMAIVAGRSAQGLVACAVALDAAGVTLQPIHTSA